MSLESQRHLKFLQLEKYRKDKGRLITFPFFIMNKKKLLIYLEDTIDVCEFLVKEIGTIPEGSSVIQHINETKEIIKQLK